LSAIGRLPWARVARKHTRPASKLVQQEVARKCRVSRRRRHSFLLHSSQFKVHFTAVPAVRLVGSRLASRSGCANGGGGRQAPSERTARFGGWRAGPCSVASRSISSTSERQWDRRIVSQFGCATILSSYSVGITTHSHQCTRQHKQGTADSKQTYAN
jgi:hypothetical protein